MGNMKTTAIRSIYFVEFLIEGAGDVPMKDVKICSSKEEAENFKKTYDMEHGYEQTAVVGCY